MIGSLPYSLIFLGALKTILVVLSRISFNFNSKLA